LYLSAAHAEVTKQRKRQVPLQVQLLCGAKAWAQPALPVVLASAVRASRHQLSSGNTSRLTGTGLVALKSYIATEHTNLVCARFFPMQDILTWYTTHQLHAVDTA
jgi:hypothetical protein